MTGIACRPYQRRNESGGIWTTYYWQIVAKNSCGNTSGSFWSFTTARTTGDVTATLRNVNSVNAPTAERA